MTKKHDLGSRGEKLVVRSCTCPRCKRRSTLQRLPNNFKCADVICDFCGFLGQVKSASVKLDPRQRSSIPAQLLGAAWGPQSDRMAAGIYFPLFLVLFGGTDFSIFYLPADLQRAEMFRRRNPLSATARRAGWQGYLLDLRDRREAFVRLIP